MNYLIIIVVFLHQDILSTLSGVSAAYPYANNDDMGTFSSSDPLATDDHQWFNGDIELMFGLTQNPVVRQMSSSNMDSIGVSLSPTISHSQFFYKLCRRFICFHFHHSGFGLILQYFLIDRARSYFIFENFLVSSNALAVHDPDASQIHRLSNNNSIELEVVDFLNVSVYSSYYCSGPAPQKVYQASCSMPQRTLQASKNFKYSWKLPAGVGFDYILKLHFCELEYEIKCGEDFSVSIINNTADYKAGVMKLSGKKGVSVYAEYEVTLEEDASGERYEMVIWLFSREADSYDERNEITRVIPYNNHPWKFGRNAIATILVILIIVVSIIFHRLRVVSELVFDRRDSESSSKGCRCFSLFEIQTATNNFADELVVGSGSFGKVYKGLIDHGNAAVAIKRLSANSKQGANEFWAEIETLSKLRHTHLVTLLGYCDESSEMILVYELMEEGTLANHLYKTRRSDERNSFCFLSWEQRLMICIGAARGLDYLHTGTKHGLIHRDVKTTNILLSSDLVAKISDFGLCKMVTSNSQTHVSTAVKGTFGYLDPEYFLTRRLTKKSDVYAFGVVLLEVLCGRPAVVAQVEEEQCSLVLWAQNCIKEGTFYEVIEHRIREQISSISLQIFVEIAIKCLRSRPNARPTMDGVIVRLECALASQITAGGQHEEDENSAAREGSKGKLGAAIRKSFTSLAKSMDNWWRRC